MHKIRTRLIVSILTMLVCTASFTFIVYAERLKKIVKYSTEQAYYNELNGQFSTYYSDFQNQVNEAKKNNEEQMLLAKKQYEDLLSQQPGLIAQHTRAVIDGQSAGTSGNIAITNNSGSGSTSSTVKVSTPSSKPRTSAS